MSIKTQHQCTFWLTAIGYSFIFAMIAAVVIRFL